MSTLTHEPHLYTQSATSPAHPLQQALTQLLLSIACAAGVIDCARKTVQWEGLGGLYKVRSVNPPHSVLPPQRSDLWPLSQAAASHTSYAVSLGYVLQGVTSPLAGQMFFRASLFGAFGESKRWLGKNADGTTRALQPIDFYKARQDDTGLRPLR